MSATLGVWQPRKPRPRAVGDPIVPLNDNYPKCVVFVVGEREDENGKAERRPIGTAFLVQVPLGDEPTDGFCIYAVTARHVVQSGNPTWLRFNPSQPGAAPVDVRVPEWTLHSDTDVAATRVRMDSRLAWLAVGPKDFMDYWDDAPMLGARVYFIGLVSQISAMANANVPMVRSGTLGRLNQRDIPVAEPDGGERLEFGHLIDCRAYQGFSGSPCFVQGTARRMRGGQLIEVVSAEETFLLGLIAAHFDAQKSVQGEQWADSVKVPIHTGIGVVIPVERITELLHYEELVMDRERQKKARDEHQGEAATPDSLDAPRQTERDERDGLTRGDFLRDLRKIKKQPPADEG